MVGIAVAAAAELALAPAGAGLFGGARSVALDPTVLGAAMLLVAGAAGLAAAGVAASKPGRGVRLLEPVLASLTGSRRSLGRCAASAVQGCRLPQGFRQHLPCVHRAAVPPPPPAQRDASVRLQCEQPVQRGPVGRLHPGAGLYSPLPAPCFPGDRRHGVQRRRGQLPRLSPGRPRHGGDPAAPA